MCIRDRLFSHGIELSNDQSALRRIIEAQGLYLTGLNLNGLGRSVPVSYTHLDVYKKQQQELPSATTCRSKELLLMGRRMDRQQMSVCPAFVEADASLGVTNQFVLRFLQLKVFLSLIHI